MGPRVYWELCKKYIIEHSEKWFEENPDFTDCKTENWWNEKIHTTEALGANRPDITIINHEEKEWTFVDFAVPWDTNIEITEAEKVYKYAPIARNIQKLHRVRTRRIPVAVGSLGTLH